MLFRSELSAAFLAFGRRWGVRAHVCSVARFVAHVTVGDRAFVEVAPSFHPANVDHEGHFLPEECYHDGCGIS